MRSHLRNNLWSRSNHSYMHLCVWSHPARWRGLIQVTIPTYTCTFMSHPGRYLLLLYITSFERVGPISSDKAVKLRDIFIYYCTVETAGEVLLISVSCVLFSFLSVYSLTVLGPTRHGHETFSRDEQWHNDINVWAKFGGYPGHRAKKCKGHLWP